MIGLSVRRSSRWARPISIGPQRRAIRHVFEILKRQSDQAPELALLVDTEIGCDPMEPRPQAGLLGPPRANLVEQA